MELKVGLGISQVKIAVRVSLTSLQIFVHTSLSFKIGHNRNVAKGLSFSSKDFSSHRNARVLFNVQV